VQRMMMRAKIHRATVTEANLDYEGSITIDQDLLDAADILELERVEIYNVTNGNRFATYAIPGERGSGTICINGAAAHLAKPGNMVIIVAYGQYETAEARKIIPQVIFVDRLNKVKKLEQV
jgi:aspartate 1-decarboxylase